MIDQHAWEEDDIPYRVHERLYPGGIIETTGEAAPADALAREILRLAVLRKAGPVADAAYAAGIRDERDRARKEWKEIIVAWARCRMGFGCSGLSEHPEPYELEAVVREIYGD